MALGGTITKDLARSARMVLNGALFVLLVAAPTIPNAIARGRLGTSPDAGLLVGALFVLVWLGAGGTAAVRWYGTWRAWLIGAALTVLVTLEGAISAARYATNEMLPLYDALLLSRHLYILGRDLYGGWIQLAVLGVVLSPLLLWGVLSLCAAQVEAQLRALGLRQGGLFALAAVAMGLGGLVVKGGHWSAPRIAGNLGESWRLYRQVSSELTERSHTELVSLEIPDPPDVLIYIIESYGKVVADDPLYAETWTAALDQLDSELGAVGWRTASAFDTSPVHGGRSWIADASMLLGIRLSHESEYEHAMAIVDGLPTLRSVLSSKGYTTVLVRPSDRVRPGVPTGEPYRFDRTVFHDDLEYTGPIVGWGQIPDQYTIGFVHERLLPEVDPPVFAFFHLATAHMPWPNVPVMLDRWQDWNGAKGSKRPVFVPRTLESEVAMQVSRFKRRGKEVEKVATEKQRQNYLDIVLFDFDAIARAHEGGPQRRTLIFILGDHQPPMLAQDLGPEVPVHVLASDDALIAPLLQRGFSRGLRPTEDRATVKHEELFPILIQTLSETGAAP